MSFTGINRPYHDDAKAEVIYGVRRSTVANDPACLGSYLSLQESGLPADSDNPHLIMAVGNGDMWVVDAGRDLHPGDYLISSEVSGHAMRDDEERYPVGHIVARAAEGVEWAMVGDTSAGRKHKRISVLFGNFVRSQPARLTQTLEGLQKLIVDQQRQIDELKAGGVNYVSSER